MDGSDYEDEYNGAEEGEEEDFDFGDGSGKLDYADGDDDDDEPNPSLSMLSVDEDLATSGMKAYKIIAFEDIIDSQQTKVAKIHEVLGIASSFARILLVHYAWDEDTLLSHFFERGIDYVYKSAGVVAPKDLPDADDADEQQTDASHDDKADEDDDEDHDAGQTPKAKCRKTEVACESCMDDVPEDNTTRLNCGHRFCNDCYQTYVAMKINEGQANAITCMAYKCNTKLDETLIPKLVEDPVVLKKYHRALAESYVNDNPLVKWCTSAPHCGNAVEVLWGKQVEIQCYCHHRFCFNCLKDPHSPVPCKMVGEWMEKCEGEGETFKYISANTKDCPKCHTPVEKNGGCNLMTCRCGVFFCWTGQSHTWEKISGHSCGKYKEEKEKNADEARVSLQRYMHYYERHAHNDSSMLEAQMRVQLLAKVSVLLERTGTFTSYEEKWLARALDMLFECRRVLKWSYVLAFFIFGSEGKKMVNHEANKAHKMLFEDHQEQLEVTTEILSKKLETPPQEMTHEVHLDIMNITVLAERRCKGLFDIILTEILAKGAYGFDVSGYSFSLELSSLHSIQERLGSDDASTTTEQTTKDDKGKEQVLKNAVNEKEKEKEKEQETKGGITTSTVTTVGLNSPVAKIERKRDDEARERLWQARRVHRGRVDADAPAPEDEDETRKKKKNEEEEAAKAMLLAKVNGQGGENEGELLRKAMALSEAEMLRTALEASEKEQMQEVELEPQRKEKKRGKKEIIKKRKRPTPEKKKKMMIRKRTKEESEGTEEAEGGGEKEKEVDDLEQELMKQALAASMKEF